MIGVSAHDVVYGIAGENDVEVNSLRERMYEMMQILVEESFRGSNILFDDRELTATLENRGFQPEEIFEVLSWVHHIHGDPEDYNQGLSTDNRGRTVRVLHPEERLAFSPAAHGLIHQLYTAGAIDEILREEIIQRCIDLASDEIGLEEVKTMTLLILLKERRDALSDSVLDILEIKNFPPTS